MEVHPDILQGEAIGNIVSDHPPDLRRVLIRLKTGVRVKPFEYIVAPMKENGETVFIVLRVLNLQDINPYATSRIVDIEDRLGTIDGSEGVDLPRRYVLAVAEPVDAFRIEHGGDIHHFGPTILPKAGLNVYRAGESTLMALVGRVNHPVRIGSLVGAENVTVSIDANNLARHMIIVGTTGSGKSWFRGVLLEELHRIGIPQVNFDPLGDFVKATEELGGTNIKPGEDYKPRLDALSEGDFARLIEGRIPTPFQQAIAVSAFLRFKETSKKSLAPLEPERLLDCLSEAARDYNASHDTEVNTRMRLSALMRDLGILGTGLKVEESWTRLLKTKKIVNVDVRYLTDLQLQMVVASILRELISLRRKNAIPPLIVSFEEAHRIVPRRGDSLSGEVVRQLVRFGRHMGIGIIAITQFPDSIDEELIRLPASRVIFASDPTQLREIRGLLKDLPDEVLTVLPRLETGTAVLTGTADVIRHSLYIKVSSRRRTTHGGETPSLVE
mgnify:CR=1 FL=1